MANRISRNRSSFANSLDPIDPDMELGVMQQSQMPQQQFSRPRYGMSDPRSRTPSGRSYFDPTRIAERELRIESKRQAAALSPFTSGYDLLGGGGGGGGRRSGGGGDGGGLPFQMAQDSVMGAMNAAGQPPVFSAFGYGFARPSLRNPTHNAAKGGPIVMAGPGPIESAQIAGLRGQR